MRRLLFFVLVVTACERQKLASTSGEVDVDSRSLDFGTVTLGASSTRQLVLHNTSVSPRSGHVVSPAPFALTQDVTVPGGGSVGVALVFTPTAIGPATATLTFSLDDAETPVALSGTGKPAAVCEDQPEGAACATGNLCVTGGTCHGGACVGSAVSCDDANPCTTDVCAPASGCEHLAVQCLPPADPCEVSLCDATTGCGSAAAPDGTSCGPSDCTTAHVCMSGRCTVATVPDGYACAGSSPCQGQGTCHAGVCEQPLAQPITEAWRVAPVKPYLFFQGVSDAAGNLYWLECDFTGFGGGGGAYGCDLVSVTSSGTPRFRVAHSHNDAPPVRQLIAGGQLISAGSRHLTAASLTTGAVQWETDVPLSPAAPAGLHIDELASDGSWLHGTLSNSNDYAGSFGVGVDGMLPWSAGYIGLIDGVVVDAAGNSYRSEQPQNQPPALTASTPLDARLYSTASALGGPVAVDIDEVVTSEGAVLASTDGLELKNPPAGWWPVDGLSVLMSASARWALGTINGCAHCRACDCASDAMPVDLRGYAAGTGAQTFSVHVADDITPTQPVLLGDSTVLLASRAATDPAVMLRDIDALGNVVFNCALPEPMGDPATYVGSVALTHDRWVVVHQDSCRACLLAPQPYVQAFSVPGLSEASQGWTSERGSASRVGAPAH